MSIEKTISYEEIPYFQIYTHVIQNINDLEAGFVWVYLRSKPKDWEVIKEHLKNKFNIGDDKLKKIFSYLASHKLIKYVRTRDDKGKIIKVEIVVLNGSKFINDQQLKDLSTGDNKTDGSTGVKTQRVASHTCGSGALHIIENTNNRKDTNNRESVPKKSYCPGTPDLIITEESVKIAEYKNLDIIKIAYKFMNYAKENGWLRHDWKSAFVKWISDERRNHIKLNSNEIRSTVKEYGPGHPTWDSLHIWDLNNIKIRE